MQKRRKAMVRNFKVLLVVLVVIVIAGGAYAFAAANTVDASNAGYKANTVTGYTITNIVYDLHSDDPTKLDKITFNVAPSGGNEAAPVTVLISTTASQNFTASECVITHPSAYLATCTFMNESVATPINVVDVVALDIVVSSSAP
jgi:hypothetical protein